ncbi:hypothetical protein SI65_02774 [Aspergillus cristatus]|uniref:Uncharacterized protein n=1 Tax=Aspergillus cristatus TaxID=573508 RepID=A0A1E3BLU5_ASPCR|nr:hypothetical protein SI65_02774 [Aspergillus cristatus]
MRHPTILWYGCDHLTLTQLKCPLDVLNMEHTFDEITLACSGDSCCLCTLPAIPNIQELKNNWLSASKVAKFFKVEADDKNMEDLITLFFEMGHHVQCEEYAALRLDGATASRSPPASESGTPIPEPAIEPTQVPSPRSPVAKQSKRGRPVSRNKQPQNTKRNKASTSKQSKTTTTVQSQTQSQIAQKPPTSQPTPAIQPKPMATAPAPAPAPAPTQTYAQAQRSVPSQPIPAYHPVPTPQSFPRQSFPTPVSPPLLEAEEDALLAETFLQWKHELDLVGGEFAKVDFEQIAAYIELEERSGIKNGNQDPSQGLTGAGAAFDAELQQVSQPPIAQPNAQAQGGHVQNPAQARVAFDTAVQQQQPRPIQRQAQNFQTRPAIDATFQQERISPVHHDARQAQRPANPNVHAHPQQIATPVHHATQKFPNANTNAPLPLQKALIRHTADSSVHAHPVQPTTQRPVNVNVHAQVPLQGAPIQHPIQKPVNVNVHSQRPRQPNTPIQHNVQSVPPHRDLPQILPQQNDPQQNAPQQKAPPQAVPPQAVPQQDVPPQSAPQQKAPIQHAVPQQTHNAPVRPEQTPYDGTNWGDKGVYLPDENVYFAGDKPHSPNPNAQPCTPLPELDTTFALSESDSLALQERFNEQASFLEFTNIDELCDESGDAIMLDVSASSEQHTAAVQGSQGQNVHQPIDPLLSSQYGNQAVYDRVQTSGSGRSTPSHMNMNMSTEQPVVQEFVQQPPRIVFYQNDPNAVTQPSSEEVHQIAAATKPKRKGRGRPRKAKTASVTIVDNGNSTTNPNGNAITQGAAPTNTASTTGPSTTTTATTTNDPTRGISKATAATARVTKQSTTTIPPSASTTATKTPRSRSNSNTKTNATTTTNGRGRGRSTKKKDNEPKGTLVTIERPPADDTADPTEEYIQRYSNPVAMLAPCSSS